MIIRRYLKQATHLRHRLPFLRRRFKLSKSGRSLGPLLGMSPSRRSAQALKAKLTSSKECLTSKDSCSRLTQTARPPSSRLRRLNFLSPTAMRTSSSTLTPSTSPREETYTMPLSWSTARVIPFFLLIIKAATWKIS
jgi:hypothetical protein